MNKLYVGIDVGSRGNATYLMTPDGSKHCAFTVENNTGGARLLTDKVISAMESLGLDAVNIGMEATGVYGNHLVHFLRENGRLGRYRREIHVLNPKQVKKFKESYPDLPKNDPVDAFVVADCLRFGRLSLRSLENPYQSSFLRCTEPYQREEPLCELPVSKVFWLGSRL